MAIDKSNSKPWVKVTVWVLTIGLMFAFMGTGVWMLIANWGYLFSSQTYQEQLDAQNQFEYTDDDIMALYEDQISTLEAQYAENDDDATRSTLAGMSADYAAWLAQTADASKASRAIEMYERAAELDPDNHEQNSKAGIESLKSSQSE